jgi:hypothetical protein
MEDRRLKEASRNSVQGIWPIGCKEEDWSHILRCERTKIWWDQILGNHFKNIDAEMGVRRIE